MLTLPRTANCAIHSWPRYLVYQPHYVLAKVFQLLEAQPNLVRPHAQRVGERFASIVGDDLPIGAQASWRSGTAMP